ncbi:hypothetical protein E2C01_045271 [Portunus trituberculatus]|uniref:Uncharacterized protein n=1 Tax=Portunus trituberculatus TaxID=210409 RepID=A0A5B7G0T5_PORTR|nr:hypothetical protein [Portunus trituberculatus]
MVWRSWRREMPGRGARAGNTFCPCRGGPLMTPCGCAGYADENEQDGTCGGLNAAYLPEHAGSRRIAAIAGISGECAQAEYLLSIHLGARGGHEAAWKCVYLLDGGRRRGGSAFITLLRRLMACGMTLFTSV